MLRTRTCAVQRVDDKQWGRQVRHLCMTIITKMCVFVLECARHTRMWMYEARHTLACSEQNEGGRMFFLMGWDR